MHRPTFAVFWEVFRRYRWWLLVAICWYLVVANLCHALADGVVFGLNLVVHEHALLFLLLLGISPMVCALVPLFAYAVGADIASKESTFPARMFALPLTTPALVAWPMLYGTSAIALAWLAVATLVLRPGGIDVPMVWPALFLASGLAWTQALAWRPFSLPGLRMVTAVLPIGVLVTISSLRWMAGLPEALVSLALAGLILPAYAVAVAGVARARRGDQPDWRWPVVRSHAIVDAIVPRGRRFTSASGAQVWFEWRCYGLSLLVTVGLMILFLAPVIAMGRYNPRLAINSPIRSPLLLLTVPLFAATFLGGGWGRCGSPRGGQKIPAFLATRPMTCGGLIWAKLKAAAVGVILVWTMAIAAVALLIPLTGSWSELVGQFNTLFADMSVARRAAIVTLAVAFLLFGSLRQIVANMFLGLAGRSWVWTAGAVVLGSVGLAAFLLACWVYTHPEYQNKLWAAVPGTIGLVAALKLVLGGWLACLVSRQKLIPARLVRHLMAAWLFAAACLTGLLCWLLPNRLAPCHLVLPCVVLLLPLVRIALAPLALAWNRHR